MIDEPKKIGSNLDLKGIVIHQVFKDANIRHVGFKQAKALITIGEKEKLFIGRLNKIYYKKSNPIYGIFGNGDPRFKDFLNVYLKDDNFYLFSTNATLYYKTILEGTINATGGYLIFADFVNNDNNHRYMLVLTINNKDGYVVSESDLSILDIKNLDLSKIDIACMINLTKWKEIEDGTDTEGKTYLSFVKGNKDISYYFMSFIDCDNKTTNTESTKRLTNAIEAYADFKKFDRETRIKKRNQIYEYCEECLNNNREINLSSISTLWDIENPNDFLEFASSEEYGVSSTIKGDRANLKKLKYIIYKDNNYSLEFDSKLLGTDIIYNRAKNELTFKRIPQKLKEQIPE